MTDSGDDFRPDDSDPHPDEVDVTAEEDTWPAAVWRTMLVPRAHACNGLPTPPASCAEMRASGECPLEFPRDALRSAASLGIETACHYPAGHYGVLNSLLGGRTDSAIHQAREAGEGEIDPIELLRIHTEVTSLEHIWRDVNNGSAPTWRGMSLDSEFRYLTWWLVHCGIASGGVALETKLIEY